MAGRRLPVIAEAIIIGGVVGPVHAPTALLLGRRDERGRLRYFGRTSPLTAPQRRGIAAAATPVGSEGSAFVAVGRYRQAGPASSSTSTE
ncbi:hypothetical protein [Paractinoplanes rishiriensis]|uniref:Uncharacterized protein n=1 Tax=Paractinoplanes rishiriensis TaxID=1050105 RepID=A0A919MZJ1_9ACTN|nr:hypothetical protein [Actinoplanes rishiriensis]GIF01589.1 hypothetical protein Ari01nite_90530 [Actinoplanes rishiriensis]